LEEMCELLRTRALLAAAPWDRSPAFYFALPWFATAFIAAAMAA
jgi:hypothetical protein